MLFLPALTASIRRLPAWAWLIGVGVVLFIRFPIVYLLHPPYLMDFDMYRILAGRVLGGHPEQLYVPTSERMVFKYAPVWGVLMLPFGWLSSHASSVVWAMLSVACLVTTCWLGIRLCRLLGTPSSGLLVIPAILLIVRPITSAFLLGQTDLIWGALIAGFLFCEITQRRWLAAFLLALASSLKLPALLFLAYFFFRRRWASIARTVCWLIALNLTAAVVLLPRQPLSLFLAWKRTLYTNGITYAFDLANQSLLALLGRFLRQDGYGLNLLTLPDGAVAAMAAVLQLILFIGVFVPSLKRLSEPSRFILDGALVNVLMVLCSPSCWVAMYSALLLPVMIGLSLVAAQPRATWRQPLALFSAAAGLVCSALMNAKLWHLLGVKYFKGESYVYLVLMILPFGGLALTLYLWCQRRLLARLFSPTPAVSPGDISRS